MLLPIVRTPLRERLVDLPCEEIPPGSQQAPAAETADVDMAQAKRRGRGEGAGGGGAWLVSSSANARKACCGQGICYGGHHGCTLEVCIAVGGAMGWRVLWIISNL